MQNVLGSMFFVANFGMGANIGLSEKTKKTKNEFEITMACFGLTKPTKSD